MKKILSLALAITVSSLALISLPARAARAQEVASAGKSLDEIKEEYERLLAIERDPSTPTEAREMNRTFLEARRAQLADALRKRIATLRRYQTSVVTSLSDEERRVVEGSIQQLSAELQALQPARSDPPARATRRPPASAQSRSVASQPRQPAPASDAAESADEQPTPGPGATRSRKAAAIEITSPERDKTVHVGEVEVEVTVNDEDVDDIMVAVYTPGTEKPKSARTLELKRSDKGVKSFVVSLSEGENRVEVSDLKRVEVKAERNLIFTPPDAPGIGSAAANNPANPATPQGGAAPPAPATTPKGHLVGLLLGGAVMSQQGENFSQADPFMGFIAGYSHGFSNCDEDASHCGGALHWRVQGIFQVQPQKEEAPVASATPTASPTPAPTPAASPTPIPLLSGNVPFLASRKTFDIDMHIWYDWPVRHFIFFGRKDSRNSDVRIGPYATVGASTFIAKNELKGDTDVRVKDPTNSSNEVKLDPTRAKIENDLKHFEEFGLISNFFKWDRKRPGDPLKPSLFMQAIVAFGNYESMAGFNPGKTGFLNDSRHRFIGKLRIFPHFLDNEPDGGADSSPMFGVEINAGRGPDQIKFFTGIATAFKLFK